MRTDALIDSLSKSVPRELATELVSAYMQIREDTASLTLGRSAPGKLVESLVQTLQYLVNGTYDAAPAVDAFLRNAENAAQGIDDGLRICATRIARAMYALRSKRNIVHKGEIDPNDYDLRFLHAAAQWILAELIRHIDGLSMDEAGRLIDEIEAPIGPLVEEIDGKRVVLKSATIRDELLVLFRSAYPERTSLNRMVSQLDRRKSGSVRNAIRELWKTKLIEGDSEAYVLTQKGLREADAVIRSLIGKGQPK